MNFEDWGPFYEAILEEFGYDRSEDRRSARVLDSYIDGFDLSRLDALLRGKEVAVVGNAPSLEPTSVDSEKAVVAADAAALRLEEAGVGIDVTVTDLDGAPEYAAEASEDTIVAVHAHGDNRDAVDRHLPEFETRNVVGTTQTRPLGDLYNFGGFTDGDRAAFLADESGASSIDLVGFDFDAAEGEKRSKLRWARCLLRTLAEERDERLV
jgi:uncharacterized Rossmann fold enzyme